MSVLVVPSSCSVRVRAAVLRWTKAVLRVPFTLGCQGEAGSGWTFERRSCRNAGGPAVGGLFGTRPLWASWSGVS